MKNFLSLPMAVLLALAGFGSMQNVRAAGTPPPPGMVLWLPLDESAGPVAANLVPGTPAGAWSGTPAVLPEHVLRGLSFDGSGSAYVDVPNYAALEIGTNDFTLDCWMRFDGPFQSGDYIIINKYSGVGGGGVQWGYGLALSNGRLHCRFADGTIGAYSDTMHVFMPDASTWHHVAVTVRRGLPAGGQFYVDGVPTGGFNPTAHQGSVANGQPFRVAKAINAVQPGPWPGGVDEIEVFNRALSAAEIQALFAAGRDGKFKPNCAPPTGYSFCFNTGMNANGTPRPAGSVDPLFQAASLNFLNYPDAYVQGLPAYPLWNVTPSPSQWITPNVSGLNYLPLNTYTFRATFLLPNPAGSHVVGRWLAGAVGRILVNGVPQPAWNTPGSPTFGATTWTPVNITANLVAGLNTLDFEVDVWSVTPCGLRAELCVTSPPPANCVSLACPADQVIWTCGTNAVASYTVTATNACGGAANLLCLPPPGTVLPAGTNLVQCTAYDGLGACANCTFKIIVRRDTNAPVLLGPGPITEYVCGGGLSGPVNFTVLATDDSGAALTVICTNQFGLPVASGQAFPLGTNTVTCFTADACGRTTQCSFTVTVVNQLVPFNFSAGRRNSGQGWSFLDVFQGWVREPATPGACLNAAFPTPPVPWKHFDDSRSDQWFAQDFPSLPAGLASARLDAVMRPYPSLYFGVFFQGQPTAEDDVIKLRHLTCAPGGGFAWGQEIRQLPGSGGVWSLDPLWRTISLDLANLPPGFPGNTNNLLPLLNTPGQRRLDVLVQDDTTVDYLQLSGTFCPSEPFIGGVPAVLGPGVSLLRVPDAAAALRLAAPATGEVTLATFPLNGASGLALRCAGWGTGDLNNDGATDPVDAFSTVRAPGVCFNGRCLDYAVTFTPDGQVEVTFTPDGHPGTNAKVVMSFRDAAGQPITSVTNSLSLAFTKIKYEYKARPMTNGGCFDLWAGPGLIVHQPMPASGANEWLLLSLQAGCGFVLSNGPSGQTGAAVDMFLQIDDALAVVPPRPVLKEFQLTTRGLDGATLATLDPVLPALVNPRAAPLTTGRRQYKPLMTRKRIDKSTPLLLPHPGGWNLTGLAATSSVSLRFAGLISSLVGPCIRVNHDEMTASMVSQYRGSIAGVPDQVLDTCAVRLIHNSPTGGDGLRLEPDFSALGASTFRVQIYDAENVLLHDRPGQTGDAGSATAWPFSWGRLGGTVRSRLFGWETPVRYALGTQLFTNVATVLILAEEGPTAPLINGLSGLDLHTVGIRLLDFGSVQTDIGAQREIRVVTDGAAPRVTWSPVGGQLEVSTNLVQWTGTTNASGQPLNGPAPARYFRVRE